MVVKFLKAGTGDAIIIHHNEHNIFIDGGNDSGFLLTEVERVYQNNQKIDLLIITHHDDDHIKGIIELLKYVREKDAGKESLIKQVIFNSPRKILTKEVYDDENLLSYRQAKEVEDLLGLIGPNWELVTESSNPIELNGLVINFLSPTQKDIEEYSQRTPPSFLTSDYKCDWETPFATLEKYVDDKSQDNSVSNKSSVVISVECEGKKILLTGDVTPDRFEVIVKKLVQQNQGNRVMFDFVKLPHHGSYRSLNKNIIENIACTNFIVSTNGKKHFLPNKRAFIKILKYLKRGREPINFIFNYGEVVQSLKITDKEQKDYNFILTPNNEKYGIVIR